MLLKLLRGLTGGVPQPERELAADAGLLEYATAQMMAGDNRSAIRGYREYLRQDPTNVRVLNDLGACLAETGDLEQASASFELAYSLDDTFTPAMVNHAKLLNDNHRGAEALEFLRRAKICHPAFRHTDAVYAGLLLKQGHTRAARDYQLKSWLAHFDNLRAANSHLFWMGYDDVDEAQLAAEHRFWAETLKPLPPIDGEQQPSLDPGWRGRRIRIGYWSPDLRNHSVRYFFRPLLEGHDRTRFEIVLIHDFPGEDHQTQLIRAAADAFHPVHDLTDEDLRDFIRAQRLDLLVDLAGHTSHNRMSLLQCRMAPVQVNALGYPPTTGLPTVDAKLLDRHVLTPEAGRYYTEEPLALPGAFWCFDPMEEAPEADEPPHVANGYITFGCVGNVAKITERVARAWTTILEAVPRSRLLVRSVSFADPLATDATRDRLAAWGLPMARVDLKPPQGGAAFFASYHEIDIILDTFPFNGGTTTCFATYMGVPVVSLAGRSLIARMGLSVLANLGASDLAVDDLQVYVRRAIALAGDAGFMRRFKREARATYRATPLGNGTLFAREFEQACIGLLERRSSGDPSPASWRDVVVLPEKELVRRAYAVLRGDQPEAGQRILSHCLREYPDAGGAHVLQAQLLVWGGQVDRAIAHLSDRVERFSPEDRAATWLALARMHLLQGNHRAAEEALERVEVAHLGDAFDRQQLQLYGAAVATETTSRMPAVVPPRRVLVLVPCDESDRFQALERQWRERCPVPAGWSVTFERCSESRRTEAYVAALEGTAADWLVIAQKHVRCWNPGLWAALDTALQDADLASCAGADRWQRLDWRFDAFAHKAGGFLAPSTEQPGRVDLHILGLAQAPVAGGLAILDGTLLAVRLGAGPLPAFDEALAGADTLLEEAWTHACARAGRRLTAHRNLGVFPEPGVELEGGNRSEARMHCAAQQGFEPFAELQDDNASLSVPCAEPAEAVAVAGRYLGGAGLLAT